MPKISVLIPSRNEQFLFQTIEDIYKNSHEDIEVIALLDGYWPSPIPKDHKTLTLIHLGEKGGMRHGINASAAVARGDFLLKCDAHCAFAEGFDTVLLNAISKDDDVVMIPRRYSLDAHKWGWKDNRPCIDYHYLSYPYAKENEIGMHGNPWSERKSERRDVLVDEEMSSQGSCWFMPRRFFLDFLGGLSEVGYGTFVQEFQEIGLKTWLGGGRVLVNKNTWYAHLHKGKEFGRGYFIDKREMMKGAIYSADFWMHNKWKSPPRIHTIEWFIERFWPVPTWPKDFLEHPDRYRDVPANARREP